MKQIIVRSSKTTLRNEFSTSTPIPGYQHILRWLLHWMVSLIIKNKRKMASKLQKGKETKQKWNSTWDHPYLVTPPKPGKVSTQPHWVPPIDDESKKQSTKWEEENQVLNQMAVDDTTRPKWRKWKQVSDFHRRPSKATTAHPTPPLGNSFKPWDDERKNQGKISWDNDENPQKDAHDTHLWTPIPKRRIRTRLSTNIQPKW